MKSRRYFAALALGTVLSGGAAAAPADPPDALQPQLLLQGLVSEAQVTAVFDYLRNALIAAAEGREGPVPDLLRRELEKIDAEVRLRGTLAGLLLLKSLEAEIRSLLRAPGDPAPPRAAPPDAPWIRT